MKIPSRYCPECLKEGLEKLDLAEDDRNAIAALKRAIPVAGALGGRDAALAEVCFILDMPVPPDMQRQELDKRTAAILLAEMRRRWGRWMIEFIMENLGGGRAMHEYMERRNERARMMEDDMRRYRSYEHQRPITMGLDIAQSVEVVEKFYYVPEYRVKENKR